MYRTIEDRLICLLESEMRREGHGFWGKLEVKTGVSSQRWRKSFSKLQRPTPDMLESAFKTWPKHAFWLATGVQDEKYGHTAPEGYGYPQAATIDSKDATKIYFEKLIQAQAKLEETNLSFTNSIRPLDVELSQDEIKLERLQEVLELHSEIRWVDVLLTTFVSEFGSKELEFILRLIGHKINTYEQNAIRLDETTPESVRTKAKEKIRQYEQLLEWMNERDKNA
jgi:hypothetical protein